MSTKTICVKCGMELKPFKNEVTVIETTGNPPQPHKIWMADMWACPGCNIKVVKDFGLRPWTKRGDDDFDETLERAMNSGEMVIYNHEPKAAMEMLKKQDIEADGPKLIDAMRAGGL